MTQCQCTGPGWCERHKVKKSAHLVHLCQTKEHYFQAWEEGRGPGQYYNPQPEKTQREKQPIGPGTMLRKIVGGCKCWKHEKQMNEWGVDECAKRIETIMKWLIERSKPKISETSARRLITYALHQSRQEER